MWQPSEWASEEDVLTDLLQLAEYNMPLSESECRVPETIIQYKKQMVENKQRTLNSDIDESACYIVSGRGRGIRDRIICPGGIVDSHPSDEAELKKQIRQVSGFGYSNELIEQSIKAKVYDLEKCIDSSSTFRLVPTSSSSSGKSSSETTPTRKK